MMLEFKMNLLIFALLSVTFASKLPIKLEDCYHHKFSPDHSGCKERNPKCKVVDHGFTDKEKKQIVRIHNEFREKVALGNEEKAAEGALPQAANMREMEWDVELAGFAQKWAEQCKFEHDCEKCRRNDRFKYVGQILYKNENSKEFKRDDKAKSALLEYVIKRFYENKEFFIKEVIGKYVSGKNYGNFTQIIWADSWRLGCGKAYWKTETGEAFMLVCNYGPTGNIVGKPVYKKGESVTRCPKDTCYKKNCEQYGIKTDFDGLCKATGKSGSLMKHDLISKDKSDDNDNDSKDEPDFYPPYDDGTPDKPNYYSPYDDRNYGEPDYYPPNDGGNYGNDDEYEYAYKNDYSAYDYSYNYEKR